MDGFRTRFATRRVARDQTTKRVGRVRQLRAELDVQGSRSIERTKTVETKASFTLTAAALVAGGSISLLETSPLSLLPLLLAALTVYHAAQAAKPLSLNVPSARQLVDEYLEADMTEEELEDTLLEVRTVEIEQRDAVNTGRSRSMTIGFRFLTASVAALVLSATLAGLSPGGTRSHEQEQQPPTPTETSEAP